MVLFKPSPQELEVEKATSELNLQDDWSLIMTVCDKAGKSTEDAKNYLKAIIKRLHNTNPHISLQAVTLLDACVKNSGKTFHLEIASGEFEAEYTKLLTKCHPKVIQKLKESLKKWVEGEFKNDVQLNLIPSLYHKLKSKGVEFTSEPQMKKTVQLSKDPNVVNSQEEEDQIAKAIELSLKENSGSPRAAATSSLYPSTNLGATSLNMPANSTPAKEPRKVRALYDFEAAEDNELTFNSGEIIFVLDDSDANWWKGSNQRGEGLFPASFVTADLSAVPEQIDTNKKKPIEIEEDKAGAKDPGDVEVDESKIDRLLHLLHEADPTSSERDTEEMLKLEREVNAMGPLIDTELERVDRKHAQLAQLSTDLVEALSLYHQLMREPQQPMSKMPFGYGQPPSHSPHPMSYNGAYPHMSMGPPPSMGHYTSMPMQDRPFMPPPGTSQFQSMQQGLPPPPNMMGHPPQTLPNMQMPPGSGPPQTSLPPGMPPPGLGHPQPGLDERIQPNLNHPQMHQGMPSFGPTSIPPGFPPNGPQMPVQNGPGPQSGHFPPPSNTHIM